MGDIDVHRRFYSNIAAHLNMVVVSPGYDFIFNEVASLLDPDSG